MEKNKNMPRTYFRLRIRNKRLSEKISIIELRTAIEYHIEESMLPSDTSLFFFFFLFFSFFIEFFNVSSMCKFVIHVCMIHGNH